MNPFESYKLKCGVELRNKIAMAPMTLYSSNDDLTLSKEEEIYYEERSYGVGMLITAATAVNTDGQAFESQISAKSEYHLDSLKRLANSIRKGGAKSVLQLHHGGRMSAPNLFEGQRVVAPSAVKALRDNLLVPEELTHSEIVEIIEDFKNATLLAIKAGFDGVEIHGANTYLVQQFYSPHSNRRTDMWGDRLMFPLTLTDAIIKVVKNNTDGKFIVGYRFSPEELEEPGITLDDTLVLLDKLKDKNIDYLHVSLGVYNKSSIRDKEDATPIAKKMLEVIDNKVPLMGVGSVVDVKSLKNAFDIGYDLIAIGTALIVDPNLVEKMEKGKKIDKTLSYAKLPSGLRKRLGNVEAYIVEKGFKISK